MDWWWNLTVSQNLGKGCDNPQEAARWCLEEQRQYLYACLVLDSTAKIPRDWRVALRISPIWDQTHLPPLMEGLLQPLAFLSVVQWLRRLCLSSLINTKFDILSNPALSRNIFLPQDTSDSHKNTFPWEVTISCFIAVEKLPRMKQESKSPLKIKGKSLWLKIKI